MAVSRFMGSLPVSHQVFQMSGSATGAPLSDKTLYPNFFRVIPPDSTQVQVMLQLLEQLDWNYVAIVYDEDDYGRSAATELRRLVEGKQICVPIFESMPIDTSTTEFLTKARSITAQLRSSDNGLVRGMVILGGSVTTRTLISELSIISYLVIILSEAASFDRSVLEKHAGSVYNVARGALLTSPQYLPLGEFRLHWNSMWENRSAFLEQATSNPWLRGFYTDLTKCDVSNSDCWNTKVGKIVNLTVATDNIDGLNLYTWYIVKAAAIMARLLKQVHAQACGGGIGVCPEFLNAIRNRQELQASLKKTIISLDDLSPVSSAFSGVSVKFDDDGEVLTQPEAPQYIVSNFRQMGGSDKFVYREIGVFANNTLSINKTDAQFYINNYPPVSWTQLPPAQCPADHNCLKCQRDLKNDVVFIEGHFYVVALISVYFSDPTDSLACGEINLSHGAALVQSVIFAVDEANKKMGMFQNVLLGRRIGILVINLCNSPLLVRQRILDLYAGRLTLPDGRNSSFLVPFIMGFVGATYSSNSIAASETLTAIARPFVQVSTTSTSQALSDRTKHPYFMRLVPPDNTQAQVLLAVVAGLRANYIQVIYDGDSAYSTGLYNGIVNETRNTRNGRYNVCIAQGIKITPRQSSSEYKWIVDKLRDKSYAKLVIVILHEIDLNKTLDAILPKLDNDNFVFLGSDSWGRQHSLLHQKLKGSLVLSLELASDTNFERFFSSMDPQNKTNPWLKSFWETRENCYFDKSFNRKAKVGRCPENIAQNYKQDARASFHINAVYSLVLGFNATLSKYCGPAATLRCSDLTSERLVNEMKKVQLDLYNTGNKSDVFDKNGDGLGGFKVLQIVRDLSSSGMEQFTYKDVGKWSDGVMSLESDLTFSSVCPNEEECQNCVNSSPDPISSPEIKPERFPEGLLIGLCIAGFVSLVLAVVVALLVRRQWFSEELKERRPEIIFENDNMSSTSYLTLSTGDLIASYQPGQNNQPVHFISYPDPSRGTLV